MNTGDTILPSQHNPAMQDIGQTLGNSLDRDGRGGMRADLQMGGFRATNMAPGTDLSHAATVAQASVPIGTVLDFAGSTAPDGYLLCYGQAVARSTYAVLFAVLGTTFGGGDGSTTFNLPDLRGRVSAGKDNMGGTDAARLSGYSGTTLGGSGGAQDHTLTEAQMPSHNHGSATGTAGIHSHTVNKFLGSPSGVQLGAVSDNGALGAPVPTSSDGSHNHTIASSGGGQAHPNVQPTIILNKIMKATL